MAQAYVLIEVEPGHTRDLVRRLQGREGVVEAAKVYGPCDVVALIEAAEAANLNDVVSRQIHPLEGVVHTTTCLILD